MFKKVQSFFELLKFHNLLNVLNWSIKMKIHLLSFLVWALVDIDIFTKVNLCFYLYDWVASLIILKKFLLKNLLLINLNLLWQSFEKDWVLIIFNFSILSVRHHFGFDLYHITFSFIEGLWNWSWVLIWSCSVMMIPAKLWNL